MDTEINICHQCIDGNHDECLSALCECLADHIDDIPMMRGFKDIKRQLHPERESMVKGGWKRPRRTLRADEYEWGNPIR